MPFLREIQIKYTVKKTKEKAKRVTSSKIIFNLFKDLQDEAKEKLVAVNLTAKNIINSFEVVSIGILNQSIAHPREIFRGAIISNSASVICVHNHPSGDPAPSAEDIAITKQLAEAGKILGICLLDHIIIGTNAYVSLRDTQPKLFK